MTKTAMIFAAGFGTRMGDLTKAVPKPLLPVGGRPMIERTIDLLRDAGVTQIFANTHYLADKLDPYLEAHGIMPLREDPILETGGGLRAALPHLGAEPVITMNPDVLWTGTNPVVSLVSAWREDMTALLMLAAPKDESELADFSLEHGEIQRNGPYRYTGLQVIRTDFLGEIQASTFSLNSYWDMLLQRGPLHGLVYDGSSMDIGTKERLADANQRFFE